MKEKEKCLVCGSSNILKMRGWHPPIKKCCDCGSQQWGYEDEKPEVIYNSRIK